MKIKRIALVTLCVITVFSYNINLHANDSTNKHLIGALIGTGIMAAASITAMEIYAKVVIEKSEADCNAMSNF